MLGLFGMDSSNDDSDPQGQRHHRADDPSVSEHTAAFSHNEPRKKKHTALNTKGENPPIVGSFTRRDSV